MFTLITLILSQAKAEDFNTGSMPCARPSTNTISVQLGAVEASSGIIYNPTPWPFKKAAARLALVQQAEVHRHEEECTRLLTQAVDNHTQDTTVFAVASTATTQGRTVSVDVRTGQLATDGAGVMRETPETAFAYGVDRRGSDRMHRRNLGFLADQGVAMGVSGTDVSVHIDDAVARQKAEADRQAAAKAQAEAERQAKIAALKAAGGS